MPHSILVWIFRVPFGSPLPLFLIGVMSKVSSNPSQCWNLHFIFCMRRLLLSSSCAAHTANRCADLGALSTLCSTSCPAYMYAGHTYRLVLPSIVGLSHTFHRIAVALTICHKMELAQERQRRNQCQTSVFSLPIFAASCLVTKEEHNPGWSSTLEISL